jgi:WD40 repeat protein
MKLSARRIAHLKGHESAVYTVGATLSEQRIYTGGGDRILAEWDLENAKVTGVAARTPGVIYSTTIIPERALLLVGNNLGGIHVMDLHRKAEIKYLLAHQQGVFRMLLSPDSRLVYAAGADGFLSVWETEGFTCVYRKNFCEGKLRDLALNLSGTELALACGDGMIRILSTDDFSELNVWKAHETSVNALAFHPGRGILLSGGRDAHLNIWDAANPGKALEKIPAHNYAVYSIVFEPTGLLFATGSRDKTIKIWDAESLQFLLRIEQQLHLGHVNSVNSLHWSKYRNYLISGSDDRSVMVWSLSYE